MSSVGIYLIAVLILILLGCNLGVSFLIVSLVYTLFAGGNIAAFCSTAYEAIDKYSLLAVPLFMIGGLLMEKSGIADRLVVWCEALLRKIKGGLGAVIPLASMLFGMLTGSGQATVATMSTILVPKMEKLGWDKRYVAAMITAASPLGFMIPPNMCAIIFSTVTTASVADLFMCTVIPGILWGLGYIVYNQIVYKKYLHDPKTAAAFEALEDAKNALPPDNALSERKSFLRVTWESIPAWIMPLIILGGIFSGTFSPTEAGAVACLYGILAGAVLFRSLKVKDLWFCFRETGESIGTVLIMIPFVTIFTNIIVKSGFPSELTAWLTGTFHSRWALLLMIDVIFVLAGFFFDSSILTLVLPPILMPTVSAIGVSPVQFGAIVFCAIGVGAMTPPMCSNLYLCARISKVNPMDIVKPILPLIFFIAVPIMLLVTYVPWLSEWLPSVLR